MPQGEVIKREVLEGDKAEEARKLIGRAAHRALRARAAKSHESDESGEDAVDQGSSDESETESESATTK